jgi:hypothetical protein
MPLVIAAVISMAGEMFGWPITDQIIIFAAVAIVWTLEQQRR